MERLHTKDGRIGYAPQNPWIFPGTLRENVLAGQPFEPRHYWEVIKVTCLNEVRTEDTTTIPILLFWNYCLCVTATALAVFLAQDLRQLKNGDQTRVGVGGVMMSGGQQARVSIARAVYSNASVFVFDDPFNALNQRIAKRIMKLYVSILCTVHDDAQGPIITTKTIGHSCADQTLLYANVSIQSWIIISAPKNR